MGKTDKPRSGSMAYWPRVRAKKLYARVRGWTNKKLQNNGVLGFAGYKVGMTHIIGIDNNKKTPTAGTQISVPVTIIECPSLKIFAIRFYKKTSYGLKVDHDFFFKPSKELSRKIDVHKKFNDIKELDNIKPDEFAEISLIVYTQPKNAGVSKKKPEIFELKMNGSNQKKLDFIKAHPDKEISLNEVFKEGELVDVHAVTKGKGTQGPVKRFGIGLKSHKSEKGRRRPGSIAGGWVAQQHMMYRVAFSGQTGKHQRLQLNSQIIKIGNKPEEINPKDGFPHYGKVKTTYLLLNGSVPGTKKRMIILTHALRSQKNIKTLPSISSVSLQSKQGR